MAVDRATRDKLDLRVLAIGAALSPLPNTPENLKLSAQFYATRDFLYSADADPVSAAGLVAALEAAARKVLSPADLGVGQAAVKVQGTSVRKPPRQTPATVKPVVDVGATLAQGVGQAIAPAFALSPLMIAGVGAAVLLLFLLMRRK